MLGNVGGCRFENKAVKTRTRAPCSTRINGLCAFNVQELVDSVQGCAPLSRPVESR